MPRLPTSGYARIAQAEEEDGDRVFSDHDDDPFDDPAYVISSTAPGYTSTQPRRRDNPIHLPDHPTRPRRKRANSGVDIKAINARLERWAEEIKERFTRRRIRTKTADEELLEIHHSVFQAPEWVKPATKETLETDYDDGVGRMSKLEFDDLIESVRVAIDRGTHPKLISQGSSGSYFARTPNGKVVGVFKPKDEEPYASKNPKWTKWIHRNLFPFAFGRAMLIPNLSYVSEAAAYVLDCQLRTSLVPYTDVVGLSSKSFHYDWMDRRAHYRKGKPLPEKLGSFQVFLKGFKGATEFFREHPWPDRQNNGFRDLPTKKRRKRWDETCRPTSSSASVNGAGSDEEDDETTSGERSRSRHEFWTEELQQSFREELEKLVILDYVMRNTDRGTDNWMIRVDRESQQATIITEPPNDRDDIDEGYRRRNESMLPTSQVDVEMATPHVGAIDNSLSWPWKHPDAWRSYPFGWLFLPVSLIGQPFSDKTRQHFLPLLTSTEWWRDTQMKLRKCFEIDADFKEKMFARQIAVMKGQAWNVVETLKTPDHGPLELTRRTRAYVWDDLIEIPVAVPLPRASHDMQQRAKAAAAADLDKAPLSRTTVIGQDAEEMDISTALSSSTTLPVPDLLGSNTTACQPSGQNPFNQSRENSTQNIHNPAVQDAIKETLSSPTDSSSGAKDFALSPSSLRAAAAATTAKNTRPGAYRSRTGGHRMSHELPRQAQWPHAPTNTRRRFSFAAHPRAASNFPGSTAFYDDDDQDGDLRFATAAGQETSMRKAIVERLELVKTKPPVFSWC